MARHRIISYWVLMEIKGAKYWHYQPGPFNFSSCIRSIVIKKGDQTLLSTVGEITSISFTRGTGVIGWSEPPEIELRGFKIDDGLMDIIQIPINNRKSFSVEVPKQRPPTAMDYHFTFDPKFMVLESDQ